jgi:hypothetical protein
VNTDTVSTFAAILILATLAESIVEYLVKPIFLPSPGPGDPPLVEEGDPPVDELVPLKPATRGLVLRYVSAAIGIILCVAYSADLLALVGLTAGAPLIGQVITGIVVGRGANYLHDLVGQWDGM